MLIFKLVVWTILLEVYIVHLVQYCKTEPDSLGYALLNRLWGFIVVFFLVVSATFLQSHIQEFYLINKPVSSAMVEKAK